MDILGPFPPAKGQLKFLLVVVDYFIKWIEACPLAKIIAENVQKFMWKNIIYRLGLLHSLITDNGRQFITQNFESFVRELDIKHLATSIEHPQTNGQAKAANKVILRELKK
uniref:Pol polyprotein n=1 Tax=Cajanus cajan TaxID=3821 RepID=A0A151RBW2_CAJCA|nr:Pol polyprotein [Cajanus cajan]